MGRRRLGNRHIHIVFDSDEEMEEEATAQIFHRFLEHGHIQIYGDPEDLVNLLMYGNTVRGKAQAIRSVPLLRALSHDKVPISNELIEILHEEHTIRSILFTDDSCRVMNKNFYNFDFDLSKNTSIKDIRKEKQKLTSDKASKLVARQYRQVTIHLHPDHHGEKFRKEFDALQVAYEILKDSESRGEYVDSMVAVIEKCRKAKDASEDEHDPIPDMAPEAQRPAKKEKPQVVQLLQMANTAFISDYMKKKEAKDSNWRRYKEKTGKKKTKLYLEASMFSQPPKSLRMATTGGKARKRLNGTVARTIRLPPLSQNTGQRYQELCRGVSIYTESQTPGGEDILLLKLKGDKLKAAFDEGESGWITTDIKLPDFGTWNVYWFATLEDASNGNTWTETPKSCPSQIRCETSRAFDARKRLPGLVTEAKKACGSLGATCRQWQNFNDSVIVTSSSAKLQTHEQKYSHLVSQLGKASDLADKLYITLEDMGWSREGAFSRQKELNELVRCVAEAGLVKDKASFHIERSRKRQGMKSFKTLVADLIENKDLSSWIETVKEEEIVASGGDMNRLYQILMEGKTVNFSDIERMSSLMAASRRTDLFNEKQSKALLEKAMEMDGSLQLGGLNNHTDASEEILPLETPVILTGLKQRADLNGREGKYMGIGDRGRFNILVDGSLYALKLENFIVTSSTLKAATGSHETKPKPQEKWQDCAPKVVQKKPKVTTASAATKKKAVNHIPKGRGTVQQGKAPIGKSKDKKLKEVIVWLPREVYPRFIGKNAKNIYQMATSTQTRMFVDTTTTEKPGYVALRIEGSERTIGIAQEHVQLFLDTVGPHYVKKKEQKTTKPNPGKALESEKAKGPGKKKGAQKKSAVPSASQPQGMAKPVPTKPATTSGPPGAQLKKLEAKKPVAPTSNGTIVFPSRAEPNKSAVTSSTRMDAPVVTPRKDDIMNVNQSHVSPSGNFNAPTSSPTNVSLSGSEEISGLVRETNGYPKPFDAKPAGKVAALDSSRVFTPITVPQSISVLSETVEETSAVTETQPIGASPTNVASAFTTPPGFKSTRSPSSQGPGEDLLVFLQQNASCIKGSPEEFHQALIEMDVKTISDLNDAVKDTYFLPMLQQEWLKGFKVNTFIVAVTEAMDHPPVHSSIFPGGLGDLNTPLVDQAAIAMQQLNFASNVGSKMPFAQQSSENGDGQSDSLFSDNRDSGFWANWR